MKVQSLSLKTRLIAGMALVAGVLVLVCIVLTITIRNQLVAQVDQRLATLAPGGSRGSIPPFRLDDPTRNRVPLRPSDGTSERISDVYQGFVTADGVLVTLFSPNFADGEYPAPAIDMANLPDTPTAMTVDATGQGTTYRILVKPVGEVVSVTGVPIDGVFSTINRLIWLEVIGSLAILMAIAMVGWWVVHLGIRPVKRMTETATQIASGDLSIRIPEEAPSTESGQLAIALNQMLGRIEGALDERAESEERLRRFVSDASHELRTPVTSIRGYAELHRMGALKESTEIADAMRRMEQEAARMGRLINDMLVLARLDEQRPLGRDAVDLASLLRDAAADAHAAYPTRSITVEAANPTIIAGDEDRLRQVISNVVGNALIHTSSTVHLSVRSVDDKAVIDVTDQGDGMTSEVAARVTERFFRADVSRSRHSGGSGLGLAIVDSAVSAHGGSVEILSTPGHGTTVKLTFPGQLATTTVPPRSSRPSYAVAVTDSQQPLGQL